MEKLKNVIKNKKILAALVSSLIVVSGIGVYALTKSKTKPKEEKIEEVAKEDVKEEVTEKQEETPVVNDNKSINNENKETTSKPSSSSNTNNNQASNSASKPSTSNKTTNTVKPGSTTSNTQAKPSGSKNTTPSKPATPKPSNPTPKPSTPTPSKPKVVTPNAIYDPMKPGDYIPARLLPKPGAEYKKFNTFSEGKAYGEKMLDEDKWSRYEVMEIHRNDGTSVWFTERLR